MLNSRNISPNQEPKVIKNTVEPCLDCLVPLFKILLQLNRLQITTNRLLEAKTLMFTLRYNHILLTIIHKQWILFLKALTLLLQESVAEGLNDSVGATRLKPVVAPTKTLQLPAILPCINGVYKRILTNLKP